MKATARWPRVARENAITALRCAVASWFALWWLNAGIGGRHNVPDNLAMKGFSDHASTTEEAIHFNSDDRLSAALAAFEDFRAELSKSLADAWDAYYDGTVQKSCSDEAALARMGALAAIEHACVHLAGAASLADSADFESKGCVRSILDV